MSPSRKIPFVFIMQDDEIGTFGAESLYDRIIIYAADCIGLCKSIIEAPATTFFFRRIYTIAVTVNG